jgi:hypothetical protein
VPEWLPEWWLEWCRVWAKAALPPQALARNKAMPKNQIRDRNNLALISLVINHSTPDYIAAMYTSCVWARGGLQETQHETATKLQQSKKFVILCTDA